MKIDSSTISMASTRSYEAETRETQTSITRGYNGGKLASVRASSVDVRTRQYTVEAGASRFQQNGSAPLELEEGQNTNTSTSSSSNSQQPAGDAQSTPLSIAVPDDILVN